MNASMRDCAEEIARLCHLMPNPTNWVDGVWAVLASLIVLAFTWVYSPEVTDGYKSSMSTEERGKREAFASSTYATVWWAMQGSRVLAIIGLLIGIVKIVTNK